MSFCGKFQQTKSLSGIETRISGRLSGWWWVTINRIPIRDVISHVRQMSEKEDQDELKDTLKRLEETRKRTEAEQLRRQKSERYFSLTGDVPISPELLVAVKTLTEVEYRGADAWKVTLTYLFSSERILVKTHVVSASGPLIEFTPDEAIAIAAMASAGSERQT